MKVPDRLRKGPAQGSAVGKLRAGWAINLCGHAVNRLGLHR